MWQTAPSLAEVPVPTCVTYIGVFPILLTAVCDTFFLRVLMVVNVFSSLYIRQVRDANKPYYCIIRQILVFFIFLRLWAFGFSVCTWELELICRVFVKSEVLGDVMVCVQIHLIVKVQLKFS